MRSVDCERTGNEHGEHELADDDEHADAAAGGRSRHGSDAERHDQDADRDQKKARAVELSGVPDGLPRIIGKGVVEEMVFGRNVVDCT